MFCQKNILSGSYRSPVQHPLLFNTRTCISKQVIINKHSLSLNVKKVQLRKIPISAYSPGHAIGSSLYFGFKARINQIQKEALIGLV